MDDVPVELENWDAASVRRRVLERVRFEQSMGVEFVPRVQWAAPVSVPVAAVAAASRAQSVPISPIPTQTERVAVAPIAAPTHVKPVARVAP